MKSVIHGLTEVPIVLDVSDSETARDVLARLQAQTNEDLSAARLALRDAETDLALEIVLAAVLENGAHLHVSHRCKKIEVLVRHGTTKTFDFRPGRTIAHVLDHSEKAFGIIQSQRGEYRLQVPGSHEYLDNSLHLGELVRQEPCTIKLDLVRAEHNAGGGENPELLSDLTEVAFARGQQESRWGPACLDGDVVLLRLQWARTMRFVGLRLDLADYPARAPRGIFWDLNKGQRLANDQWPRLSDANQAFRPDWDGGNGLYIACDRSALETQGAHPEWAFDHPNTNWRPDIGLARYLAVVADLLDISTLPEAR